MFQFGKLSSLLDFVLSPCYECRILSFGSFFGFWILYTDVSEHPLCSIFLRVVSLKNNIIPIILLTYTAYKDATECSETSIYKIKTPGNHQKKINATFFFCSYSLKATSSTTYRRHFRFHLAEYKGHIFVNSSVRSTGIRWFLLRRNSVVVLSSYWFWSRLQACNHS